MYEVASDGTADKWSRTLWRSWIVLNAVGAIVSWAVASLVVLLVLSTLAFGVGPAQREIDELSPGRDGAA